MASTLRLRAQMAALLFIAPLRSRIACVARGRRLLRWQRLDSRKTMGVYSDYRDYASTLYNDPEQRPEMVKSLLVEKVGIEKVRVNP